MYVDPEVVRAKVDREVEEYLQQKEVFRARGVWLLEYSFPQVLFAFTAKNVKPYPLIPFGVMFDFSNYDVAPPSVRLVDPLTKRPLSYGEVGTPFFKQQRPGEPPVRLIQGWGDEDVAPFICLQGIREYHNNPGHAGDPWLLYRAAGFGKLARLLDLLARYGSEAINGVQITLALDKNLRAAIIA